MRALVVTGSLAVLVSVGAVSVHATASAPAPGSYRETSFDSDPQWEGVGNRSRKCTSRTFAFGWSATRAGGQIGGSVSRSSSYQAYYAKVLSETKRLDDPLTASGTIKITNSRSGSVLFGWFNSQTSVDWRPPDSLGMRIDGHGKKASVFVEYGTQSTFARSVNATDELLTKKPYAWTLEYLPDGGQWGVGLLRLTLAGLTSEVSVRPEHRIDGASFDRFGFLNVQLDGRPIGAYIDSLTLDGEPIELATDPHWEGSNNTLVNAPDCIVRHGQDFGYSAGTQFAGGEPGEVGGLVWRSSKGNDWKATAKYADTTANLGFDDALYAEGSIALERAWADGDVFIGWFNATSTTPDGQGMPLNILAANLGGPSEWGYRLYPLYRSRGDKRDTFSDARNAPRLTPKHRVWRWWICYLPTAGGLQSGRITVGLEDPSGELPTTTATLKVSKGAKESGAVLNRFGIRNFEDGGNGVVFYVDDLRYTVGPGDVGPPERCGT